MSGNKNVLLDTNVIIFASKNLIDIDSVLADYDGFYTSIISYMEVYGYAFEDDSARAVIDELFKNLDVVDLTHDIAQQVVIYRSSSKRKIKLPDAIILATARYLNADLLTDDWDDFKDLDEKVTVIKLNDYKKNVL
jgi:predicted nucleic acid-binding protein